MTHARTRTDNRIILSAVVALIVAMHTAPAQAQDCDEWHPFTSGGQIGVNGSVSAVTVWNGDLIAGGNFTTAGGQTVNRIARWDGSAWHPFTSGGQIGVIGSVQALTVWNGDLVAGGTFPMAGGQTVNRIARWDGSAWHPFTSGGQIGMNKSVTALTVWNGDLIVAGFFETAGGQTVNRIARWDGSAWHPFTSGGQIGVNEQVHSLTVYGGDLIAGGLFSTAGGQTVNSIARWDGSAWHPFKSGGQTGFDLDIDDFPFSFPLVFALTVYSGDLIAGGWFTTAGGQTVSNIARWNGLAWHPLESGVGDVYSQVHALIVSHDYLMAGGFFGSASGQTVKRIARWDGSKWHQLVSDGEIGVNDGVRAMTVYDDDLIIGGDFTTAGGQMVDFIARWFCTGLNWVAGTGTYQVPSNWIPALVPSQNRNAIFDGTVVALPPAYTVTLSAPGEANRLLVLADDVTLNLFNNDLFLHQPTSDELPSLLVGRHADEDAARLWIHNSQALQRTVDVTTISIADQADSIGRLTFATPNILGRAEGNVFIGRRGEGTFIVDDNADFRYGITDSRMEIGSEAGSVGDLRLLDGGRMLSLVPIDRVVLAREADSAGSALLNGSNVLWTNVGDRFIVGESGHASLTIQNAAKLTTESPSGVTLAKNAGSHADVLITGPGSRWLETASSISIGEGTANVVIADGGVLETSNLNNFDGGTIGGDGFVISNVFNLGSVAPGTSSPLVDGGFAGSLTIQGNYRQIGPPPDGGLDDSGSLRITLGQSGASTLNVTGTAELGGGLFIELADGADPQPEQMFDILTAGSIDPQNPTFDVAFMPGLTEGRFMKVQYSSGAAAGGDGAFITVDLLENLLGFGGATEFGVDGSATAVAVGDFDGDDSLDIAVALSGSPGSVLVLFNNGDGTSFSSVQHTVGNEPSAIAVADFTGNDRPDIAVTNAAGNSVSVLINDGTGGFGVPATVSVGSAPSGIVAADLRDIGVIDLAVTNAGSDDVYVLHNDGDGGFAFDHAVNVGPTPSDITAGHLLGTGQTDLIVANFDADPNLGQPAMMILGRTNGLFNPQANLFANPGLTGLDVEDFNNNKDIDIVAMNSMTGEATFFLNLGGGEFSPAVNTSLDGTPMSLAVWDMNVTGQPDIAFVVDDDEAGPLVRILRNDTEPGSQTLTFSFDADLAEGENPVLVSSGDVTGDGKDDLITVNAATSAAATSGGGQRAAAGGDAPQSSISIRPNQSGESKPTNPADLNGDGVVNVLDLLILLEAWGTCANPNDCPADLNGDGIVNVLDLLILLENWG